MLDRAGISLDDLAWIQRDQFVHYLTLARAGHDPADWPTFRLALADAVVAAFGLDHDDDPAGLGHRTATEVLNTVRQLHDPAAAWPAYMADVWARRHTIRPDLA